MIELKPGPLAGYYERLARVGRELRVDPRRFQLSDIVADESVLPLLVDAVAGDRPTRVVIAQDDVEILRGGVPVKPLARQLLADAGLDVEVVVFDGVEVHTEPARIDALRARLRPGDTVIALGSGVVADITKQAVHDFEADHGLLRLIVVQTANSVCAFTSGMAVLTIDQVKRTVASRLPDQLLLDARLLADAPRPYSDGGIGDASVAAVSFADYRLGHLLGLTAWEPRAWEIMRHPRCRFLARDPLLGRRDLAQAQAVALDLAACGLAMTVAGESAPLSGLEHVTSHTLDMAARHHGRPVGNHGSQCALATILSLIAWDVLLGVDGLALDPGRIDDAAELAKVQAAFGPLDTDGAAWRECWSDYAAKIAAWRAHGDDVAAFVAAWPKHREDLRRFTVKPADFVAALAAAGHPLRWEDIPTGITEEMARWAFGNARLMRKRTSVADVLAFAGLWDDAFLDRVFDTYRRLTAPGTAQPLPTPPQQNSD